METVNNLASAASRAIWGEQSSTNETQTGTNETAGREPVSGQTGNVESGEPYDKGNSSEITTKTHATDSENMGSTSTGSSGPGGPRSDTQAPDITSAPQTNPISTSNESQATTSKTGISNPNEPSINQAASDAKPSSSNTTHTPGTGNTSADPNSAPQNTQKQQGADRPSDAPGDEESQRIKDTKKEAEDAAAVDVSGPGPKTLEEKAKESGGVGAGADTGAASAGGDDDGLQKESHGEGTGEQWVKTSGMKADGGDFDASKPGAGREADRLLDEKGVHRQALDQSDTSKADEKSADKNGKDGKPSLKDKIKAKLHKN